MSLSVSNSFSSLIWPSFSLFISFLLPPFIPIVTTRLPYLALFCLAFHYLPLPCFELNWITFTLPWDILPCMTLHCIASPWLSYLDLLCLALNPLASPLSCLALPYLDVTCYDLPYLLTWHALPCLALPCTADNTLHALIWITSPCITFPHLILPYLTSNRFALLCLALPLRAISRAIDKEEEDFSQLPLEQGSRRDQCHCTYTPRAGWVLTRTRNLSRIIILIQIFIFFVTIAFYMFLSYSFPSLSHTYLHCNYPYIISCIIASIIDFLSLNFSLCWSFNIVFHFFIFREESSSGSPHRWRGFWHRYCRWVEEMSRKDKIR